MNEVIWGNKFKNFKKEGILFDMHFHTKYSDGSSSLKSIEKKCNKYDFGVAITDHNLIKGCLKAKEYNFKFIPAVEVRGNENVDNLIYFYDLSELEEFYTKIIKPNFKKDRHIGSLKISSKEVLELTKDYNCITSLPHPFAFFQYFGLKKKKGIYIESRFRKGFDLIKLADAVEVINGHLLKRKNFKAMELAKDFDKAYTGGSDGHIILDLGKVLTHVDCDTLEEFLDGILKRKNEIFVFKGRKRCMVLARTIAFRKHMLHPIYYAKRVARAGKNLIKNG